MYIYIRCSALTLVKLNAASFFKILDICVDHFLCWLISTFYPM